MRSLLLALLVTSALGGCCAPQGPCPQEGYPAFSAPAYAACRGCYTPGYRRPCFPAYRPVDSLSSP